MLKAIVVSTCALISSAAIAQPIFSEVPTYGLPSKVNNLGTVVGTATTNGYRWRPSDGLTTFAGIRITDISDDNQVMISPTHGKWTASTNQWQAPRGYQFNTTPCPNPPCIYYTQATQSYCNADGSIIAGTAFEPPPNNCHSRAVLWNSSGDTPAAVVSDGYPNGGIECTSYAYMKGMSANGDVVWGIDENQNINAVRAFVWQNGVKRTAFHGLGIASGGATPDGRYLAGYGVSQGGNNFRGIYDTINLAHMSFPNGYWPTVMAESSMLVGGEVSTTNLGNGRAFVRDRFGQLVDLYDSLLASNVQGPIAGWTLISVRCASRNGRFLAGDGYNAAGDYKIWRVDLQHEGPLPTNYDLVDSSSLGTRWQHTVAFDLTSLRFIAFGGRNAAGTFISQTMRRDPTSWITLTLSTQPSPRADHAMTQNPGGGLIMFGGKSPTDTLLSSTWRFQGISWQEMIPANAPSARGGHAMAFDALRNRVVLFGGFTDLSGQQTEYSNQTWEWTGTNWIQASPTGSVPPARFAHAMAYDPVRQRIVLFGGYNNSGALGDTWTWDGSAWSQINTPGPSARDYHSMNWDASRQTVLLVGGFSSEPNAEQWDFDGAAWTRRPDDFVGGPVWAHSTATDTHNSMLLSGGASDFVSRRSDTWIATSAPIIKQQPAAATVQSGSDVTLSVSCIGTSLQFQWRKNGAAIIEDNRVHGVTTSTLAIHGTQASDTGAYSCVITNIAGTRTSQIGMLTVISCDSIDFNNDNSVFDPQDIDAFLSVYSEGPCVPESATCNDIDFNNDGSIFDPRDIDAFLSVFSEGPCF